MMLSVLVLGLMALTAGFGLIGSMNSRPSRTETGVGGGAPVVTGGVDRNVYEPMYGIGGAPGISVTPEVSPTATVTPTMYPMVP